MLMLRPWHSQEAYGGTGLCMEATCWFAPTLPSFLPTACLLAPYLLASPAAGDAREAAAFQYSGAGSPAGFSPCLLPPLPWLQVIREKLKPFSISTFVPAAGKVDLGVQVRHLWALGFPLH